MAQIFSVGDTLREIAALARSLEDTPVFYMNRQTADGIVIMQQQAERFAAAEDAATRLDAALWAREGYVLFSSGLPDTYGGAVPDEKRTAWVTAAEIARIFGGDESWSERCKRELA